MQRPFIKKTHAQIQRISGSFKKQAGKTASNRAIRSAHDSGKVIRKGDAVENRPAEHSHPAGPHWDSAFQERNA
jgi:hypothetical protein